MVNIAPDNTTTWQVRAGTNGTTAIGNTASSPAPYWVKIVRSGNTFTGYASSDGTNFMPVGSYTIAMATNVYVGLAVTSHNNGVLNTSTFDHVTVTGTTAPLPPSVAELTDGNFGEAGSVFLSNRVGVTNFTSTFTFQMRPGTTPMADGLAFVLQGVGPTALGPPGGGLGYGSDHVGGGGGLPHSVAIKFDLFNNQGEGPDSTGLYFNGAPPTVPAVDLSNTGIQLHSGDLFAARINYDGSTLTLRITDANTGAQVEVIFRGVNIPAAIGGTTAFVGFTGGTGGFTATQDILAWNYTAIVNPSAASPALAGGGTPVPVAAPVVSAAPAPAAGDGLAAPNATLVNIVVGQPQAPAGTGSVVSVSAPVPRAPDAGVTGLAARAVAGPGMPADPASDGDAPAPGGALSDVVGAAQAGTLDTNQPRDNK
jgi:hypothetical protein